MNFSIQSKTSTRKYLQALLCFSAFTSAAPLLGTAYTVNSVADTNTGTGTSGTLRYCLNQANTGSGNTITFGVAGTITLSSSLPPMKLEYHKHRHRWQCGGH